MDIYLVGGAVRDELLGLPVTERDWVVVGATPELLLKDGFRPVGKDFPVFLHLHTHEEYALARTERKSAPGYHGFQVHAAPDVTLEDDLRRRDLTINAMARDAEGRLIDPWSGVRDLEQRGRLDGPLRVLAQPADRAVHDLTLHRSLLGELRLISAEVGVHDPLDAVGQRLLLHVAIVAGSRALVSTG